MVETLFGQIPLNMKYPYQGLPYVLCHEEEPHYGSIEYDPLMLNTDLKEAFQHTPQFETSYFPGLLVSKTLFGRISIF